jgi:hypothetical protein
MNKLPTYFLSFILLSLTMISCRQIFGGRDFPESPIPLESDFSEIVVTSPIYGSIWKPGDTLYIKWISSSVKRVNIELYRKSSYQLSIENNIESSGLCEWIIPANINLSNHYLIRVINCDNPDVFEFSGRFGIQ